MQPSAEDPEVVVEVGPGGRWVAEYYPHDSRGSFPTAACASPCAPRAHLAATAPLRLGRDGRIVSPPDLAKSARLAAGEVLAAYEEQPTPDHRS